MRWKSSTAHARWLEQMRIAMADALAATKAEAKRIAADKKNDKLFNRVPDRSDIEKDYAEERDDGWSVK